jgi:hypothetical protein
MATSAGGIGEFKVIYGFTRDCEKIAVDVLQYRGLVKVLPEAIGIYRTGDRYGVLLTIARAMERHSYRDGSDSVAPRAADVAPNTDGIPEHVIDPRRVTILHDERLHLIILQVPGRTHFVLKPRRSGFTPASEVEHDLLEAFERCTRTKAQPVICRWDYFSSLPVILVVAAIIVFTVLFFLSHFTH